MVNQTSHVHADAEGNDVQIEVDAVGETGPDVKRRHSRVESEIESLVTREVSTSRGLLVQFVNAPMTACPRRWAALRHQPAENLLRAPWRKIVERSTGAQGPKDAECSPSLEMHQMTVGRELLEENGIGNRVCQTGIGKWSPLAESPVEMIGPVVGGVARAQAFGAIAGWRGSGERHPIIHRRVWE